MNTLAWSDVAARLAAARNYWLHTTGPDGAPNASPVWGVALDDDLYFYTESRTVKARNLMIDQRIVLHLESASDVVVVHGRLHHLGHPADRPNVVNAFDQKYDRPDEAAFLPSSDDGFDTLYVLDPVSAITWSLPDTEGSTLRWARKHEVGPDAP